MNANRSLPLVLILFAAAAVLIARSYQVQIVEHEVWADEAKRLVHSGRETPYRRGRILDTKGRVLARDKDTHHLVLVYRDFRRGHPLGQIAHARSLLAGRPVSLAEAAPHLLDWADELIHLTPSALKRFAEGGELELASLRVPATQEPGREGRRRRAQDLGFYIRRLVSSSDRERRAIEKAARDKGRDLSFAELACGASKSSPRPSVAQVWAQVVDRFERAAVRLELLAGLLEWPATSDAAKHGLSPVARLIDEIESTRRWVEDATAAKLFAESAGFSPGRIDPETLHQCIDLAWIAQPLGWDDARLQEWMATTRRGWRDSWRDGYALPRLMMQLAIDPSSPPRPDQVLARAASTFLRDGTVESVLNGLGLDATADLDLAVLSQLDDLFEQRFRRRSSEASAAHGPVLPIESAALRARHSAMRATRLEQVAALNTQRRAAGRLDDARRARREQEIQAQEDASDLEYWGLIDAAWDLGTAEGEPDPERHLGRTMRALLASRRWDASERMLELARELVDRWDIGFQDAVCAEFERRIGAASADELSADGRLVIAEENRDRAVERAEFFLKDYGRRPRPLMRGEPSYDVIYLLTRFREDYAGFDVREARVREYPVLDGDTVRIAPGLVGDVTSIGIGDVLKQREDSRRMLDLKRMPDKSEQERHELEGLVGSVLLHDEVKGVAGVEGFWNHELIGRNGYYESQGLEDVFGAGRDQTEVSKTEDGRDVVVTLDGDLQRAARRTLKSRAGIDDPLADRAWYEAPIGAAVLLSVDGDVLAAVSEPNGDSIIALDAPKQRRFAIERTTQIPTFQPPGSVFKPFVAAYALSEVGIDPRTTVDCVPLEDNHAGYVDVHCHNRYGHQTIAMEHAIMGSCNSYFAWLGESLTEADLRATSAMFGFEQRTGIRTAPAWDDGLRERGGLNERAGGMRGTEYGAFSGHDRRLLGNGLGAMDITPLQLSRAILALATGELRDLRLVRRVGNAELAPSRSATLPLRPAALEFVREGMRGVTNSRYAQRTGRALGLENVGFAVAAKTGSADITATKYDAGDGRMVVRKHTWVAGWAPADNPKVVFVVFVHNTAATSSHGAIYLARDLLLQPEVLAYLGQEGVDLSKVPAR